MKVLHLNTSLNESSAPYKLHKAMLKNGIDSKILVLNNTNINDSKVVKINKNIFYSLGRKIADYKRRILMKQYSIVKYMPVSLYPYGMDISNNSLVLEADVIILHWIYGDFLSPKTIEMLLKTGKKIYWFCHDNAAFTGGCHVRLGCELYTKDCGNCPILQNNDNVRLTNATKHLLEEKKKLLKYSNLSFFSPSSWMDKNIANSIFKNKKHYILPNVIDTDVFLPIDKIKSRIELEINKNDFVILVGLKANEMIPYNGTEYLWEILNEFYKKYKIKQKISADNNRANLQIVVFGVNEIQNKYLNLPVKNIGFIKEQNKLSMLYSVADVYLVTSLEDSFNQTVAECMACNTSVVAFNNGGIADIIDHKENGYLAKYKNIDDAVEGLFWAKDFKNNELCRKKIINSFSSEIVVNSFVNYLNE